MNKVSSFLPWTTKQININQSLKGKRLQQAPARTVLVTTDQTPHFKWGSGQIQRSVGQNQKLFAVMWLLTSLTWKSISSQERISPQMVAHQESCWVYPTPRSLGWDAHIFTRWTQSISFTLLQQRPAGLAHTQANAFIPHWHRYNRCLGSDRWAKWKLSFHAHWILALSSGNADRAALQYPIHSQYCPSGTGLKPQSDFQQTT